MGNPTSWYLVSDGRRFTASAPEFGDETGPSSDALQLSFGISTADVAELQALVGRPATFTATDGRTMASLRLTKIDADLNLAVCALLEDAPLLGRGWREESVSRLS